MSWTEERIARIDDFLTRHPKLGRRSPEALNFLLDERNILVDDFESFPIAPKKSKRRK